jgi:hypothetical protein
LLSNAGAARFEAGCFRPVHPRTWPSNTGKSRAFMVVVCSQTPTGGGKGAAHVAGGHRPGADDWRDLPQTCKPLSRRARTAKQDAYQDPFYNGGLSRLKNVSPLSLLETTP